MAPPTGMQWAGISYDLRSATPPTSSVSQAKLSGSMVAIIRSRLVRIMAQRESDDALNMDFFFSSRKIVTRDSHKLRLIIDGCQEQPARNINGNFSRTFVFSGKSIFA